MAPDIPCYTRRAGDDLLFLRGVVAGARDDAVELRLGNRALAGLAPGAHAELAYQHNLRLLAAAVGLPLLIIGRVAFSRPGMLFLLAVASSADPTAEGSLELPTLWAGRLNLGLDQLQAAHIRAANRSGAAPARIAPGTASDPVSPL